jgi:hypothetical protein
MRRSIGAQYHGKSGRALSADNANFHPAGRSTGNNGGKAAIGKVNEIDPLIRALQVSAQG